MSKNDTMIPIFNIEDFIKKEITGREVSFFDTDLIENKSILKREIKGANVLVIGGAGTIGSSFIKELLHFEPGKVVVVDINENGLTELVRDCRSDVTLKMPELFITYPIGLGDMVFDKVLEHYGPFDIIANFAAHKHVRSEKDVFSIEAMILNNVVNAKHLLDLMTNQPPKHFFCVSTDKAANPVNIMGASKKLMEEVILAYSSKFKTTTARFANVAFSNGSLLDGFLSRISKKQPLACPSDVKRFFVSPKEAGQICLMACILGKSSDIFFPKLKEEDLKCFADFVGPLLSQYGLEIIKCKSEQEAKEQMGEVKNGKYPVYLFESDTSGEKLYEEFYSDNELIDTNEYSSLGIVKGKCRRTVDEIDQIIHNLTTAFNTGVDKALIVSELASIFPDFNHVETGLHLDQKM